MKRKGFSLHKPFLIHQFATCSAQIGHHEVILEQTPAME
jgi:hypothetical protein